MTSQGGLSTAASYEYRMTAVVLRFHGEVMGSMRASADRRVAEPAAAANSGVRGRDNAVGLTSILDRGQCF